MVASTPILTRLYSPADFGEVTAFIALLGMLASASTGRFDQAIPVASGSRDAYGLWSLSVLIAATVAAGVSLLLVIVDPGAGTLPLSPRGRALIPIALFATCFAQASAQLALRRHMNVVVAGSRVSQFGSQVAVQLGAGLMGLGAIGLVVGDAAGRGVAGLAYLRLAGRAVARAFESAAVGLTDILRRYRAYPLLSGPAALLNVASLQLPPLLLAAMFAPSVAGAYGVAFRILGLPASLIGQATSQTFLRRASLVAGAPERLSRLTSAVILLAFAAGGPVFLVLAISAPAVFRVVLGSQWSAAGTYAAVLAPWFFLWLVSSPVSGIIHVRGAHRISLMVTIAEVSFRVGAIWVGALWSDDLAAVALLSLTGILVSSASIGWFGSLAHVRPVTLLHGGAGIALVCLPSVIITGLATLTGDDRVVCVVAAITCASTYVVLGTRASVRQAFLELR